MWKTKVRDPKQEESQWETHVKTRGIYGWIFSYVLLVLDMHQVKILNLILRHK